MRSKGVHAAIAEHAERGHSIWPEAHGELAWAKVVTGLVGKDTSRLIVRHVECATLVAVVEIETRIADEWEGGRTRYIGLPAWSWITRVR